MSVNKYIGIKLFQFVIASIFVIGIQQAYGISQDIFDTVIIIGLLLFVNIIISALAFGLAFIIRAKTVCVTLPIAGILLWVFFAFGAMGQLIALGLHIFEAGMLWLVVWCIEIYSFFQYVKGKES